MSVIGVDIGVRHIAVCKITTGPWMLYKEVEKTTRSTELGGLAWSLKCITGPSDVVWIEEPPLAGVRNVRTFGQLSQTAGALMATSDAPAYLVGPTQWKKHIVGKGNASKEEVAQWLEKNYPMYFGMCKGNQNLIDASCIALYGTEMQ